MPEVIRYHTRPQGLAPAPTPAQPQMAAETPVADPAAPARRARRLRFAPAAAPAETDRAPSAREAAAHDTASAPQQSTDALLFDNHEDGFGDQVFPTAAATLREEARLRGIPAGASADAADAEATIEAIRREGLTGRQLRTARRLAQRHNMAPSSDLDAVRLLREAGIDPFQRSGMLDLVKSDDQPGTALEPAGTGRALTALPGDGVQLPQTIGQIRQPTGAQRMESSHAAEILRMQGDIARRRRRKTGLLFARLFMFIGLPTLLAGIYFSLIATPLYATRSEFMIQQADPPQAAGMGGLLSGTSLATSQDSIAVQGYLQSREAMLRLESDAGFREHFQGDDIDPLLRLPADAGLEEAYKLYKRNVLISYDTSEGILKLEVIAPDPEVSALWSRELISYAEQQVDHLTQRLRADAMQGARDSYVDAEAAVVKAQERVVALQERTKVLSSEVEISLLTQQIGALESQLTQERLSLAQMEANPTPNTARMEPVRRRIATIGVQIAELRARLTEGAAGGASLARIQGELLVAQADVQTRQMILSQSLQSMENARIEANRQVRFLSPSVSPIPPDRPTYPRAFENTAVTMLVLIGIYLMIAMTTAILREQLSA